MSEKIRVGVLFGGRSGEHEVSLASAANVIRAMDPEKYEVVPIGITKEGKWLVGKASERLLPEKVFENGKPILVSSDPTLSRKLLTVDSEAHELAQTSGFRETATDQRLDVIFPVLHGRFGEDGTIQGLLELADIPYVGAGVAASAVGMDKDLMKRLFRDAGLPVPHFFALKAKEIREQYRRCVRLIQREMKYPFFVKPANSGSSVGISKVHSLSELTPAIENALNYDEKILVEDAVMGREIECSVLGNNDPLVSVPGEVIPSREFYDYEAKYLDNHSELIVPARLKKAQIKTIQQYAITAFRAIDACGMARVDFFIRKKSNKIVVNEINTIPGFTRISMYPKMWEASGIGYSELIDRLIDLAFERHRTKRALRTSYSPPSRPLT